MNTDRTFDARTLRAKKHTLHHQQPAPAHATPGHSHANPTTFFLKSEKEVEQSTLGGEEQESRGRTTSRDLHSASSLPSYTTDDLSPSPSPSPSPNNMPDHSYGVESLDDTISHIADSATTSASFTTDDTLSRTSSHDADTSHHPIHPASRKRKAGNRVHPWILATGQRIISAERASEVSPSASRTMTSASPVSLRSIESPSGGQRRGASVDSSSINVASQPLTPLKMSPQPESAVPSSPRSGSPKSFRLSDEEASVADETGSQAVQSSSSGAEDEEEDMQSEQHSKASSMPQLVMPSISMPARRPFTERGRRMGRFKVLVVGGNGVGKTSLIQSMLRVCEDVVHVDPPVTIDNSGCLDVSDVQESDGRFISEVHASTRPFPSWWTDFESRRMLLRRKSVGDGVLERNLCFIDAPGLDTACDIGRVLRYVENVMSRTMKVDRMNDNELVSMLSGDGGTQIDAVLWLFDPHHLAKDVTKDSEQGQLLQQLCRWTNVVPLLGHADTFRAEDLQEHKHSLVKLFEDLGAETCTLDNATYTRPDNVQAPYCVSSALGDDAETIDASILMSSQYVQPLVPSELEHFVERLFDPENMARMRHLAAVKFLFWRQEHLGRFIGQQLPGPSHYGHTLPSVTSTGSLLEEPSKVLVPYGTSSYFRSPSPSISETSALSAPPSADTAASNHALAQYTEQASTGAEPFRQVRLAKWAQDLQRSLAHERRRYQHMYAPNTLPIITDCALSSEADTTSADVEKSTLPGALVSSRRPPRGRLGGDVAVFDPRDPLGVLSFAQGVRRRGFVALQVAGGCGLIGAVAFWIVRNWAEVQEWFGGCGGVAYGGGGIAQMTAVPPPMGGGGAGGGGAGAGAKGLVEILEGGGWRGLFG